MTLELDRLKVKLLTNNESLNNDPSNFVINQNIVHSGLYGIGSAMKEED